MSLSPGLYSKLAATSTVTAIVEDRIYQQYQRIAQKTYPAIVYKCDDVTTISSFDGGINSLRSCKATIACIGQNYTDSDSLATAVLQALDNDSSTWGSTVVQGCFLNDDGITEDVVTQEQTEEVMLFVSTVEFTVWYQET